MLRGGRSDVVDPMLEQDEFDNGLGGCRGILVVLLVIVVLVVIWSV